MEDKDYSRDSSTCLKGNPNEPHVLRNNASQPTLTNSSPCTKYSVDSTCLSLDQLKHLKLLFEVYDYVHALANGILPNTSKNFHDQPSKAYSSNGIHSVGKQSQRKSMRGRKAKLAAKPHPDDSNPKALLMGGVGKANSMKKKKGELVSGEQNSSDDLRTASFDRYDYWKYTFGFDETTLNETSLPDACNLLLMKGIEGEMLLSNAQEKNSSLNLVLAKIILSLQKLEKRQRLKANNMIKANTSEILISKSVASSRGGHSDVEHDREKNTKLHGKSSIPHHNMTHFSLRTQPMTRGDHSNADEVSHSSSIAWNLSENISNRNRHEEYKFIQQFWHHHESCQSVIKQEIENMLNWKRIQLFCKSHEEIYDKKTDFNMPAVDGMPPRLNMDHLLTLLRPLSGERSLAECEHFAFDALGLPSSKGVPFRFFAWFVVAPLFNFFFPNYALTSSHTQQSISSLSISSRCTSEGGSAADQATDKISLPDTLHTFSYPKNHQETGKRKMEKTQNKFEPSLILGEPPDLNGSDEMGGLGQSGFCPWNAQQMEAIQQLFFQIDANADGRVTWDELILYALGTTQTSQPSDRAAAKRDMSRGNDARQEHVPFPIVKFFNFTGVPTNRSPWQATYPLVHHLYHRNVFTKLLVCERSSGYITAGPDGLVKLWKPDLCFFRQNAILTTSSGKESNSKGGSIPQADITAEGGPAHSSSHGGNANRKGFTGKYSNKPPIVHARHLLSARAAITDLVLSSASLGDAEVLAVTAIDGTVTLLRVISGEVVRTFLGVRYSENQVASTSLMRKGSTGNRNGRTQGACEGLPEVKKITKPMVKISKSGVCSPFEGSVSRFPYTIRAYHDDSIEIFFGKTSKYFKGLVVVPPTFEHLVRHVSCDSDLLLNFGLQSGGMEPEKEPLSVSTSVEKGESVPWFATAVAMANCPSLFAEPQRSWTGRDRPNTTHSEAQDGKPKGMSKAHPDTAEKLTTTPFTGCLLLGFENGVLQVFAVERKWFSIHEWSMQENGYQEPPCVRHPLFSARIHSAAITRLIVSEATNSLFTVSDDATVCIRALSRLEAPALMQFGNKTANLHRHVSHGRIHGNRATSPNRSLLEHSPAIGHVKRVTCVCWSEQYRLLVTGGRDHMLIFWSPLMNRPIREIDVHNLANLAAQNPAICSLSTRQNLGACGYPVDVSFFIRSIPGVSSENGYASMESPLWLLVLTRQRVIFILHALTGRLVKALVDLSQASLALGDLFVARYEVMCDRLLLGGYCLRVWDIESDSSVYPNGYIGHRQPILYMNYVPDLTAFVTADRDEIWVWKASLEMVFAKRSQKSTNTNNENISINEDDPLSLGSNHSSILSHLIKNYPLGDQRNESEDEAKNEPTWRLKSKVMRSWHVPEGVSAVSMVCASNILAQQEQRDPRKLENEEDSICSSASSLFRLKVGFQSNGSAGCVEYTLFVALLREAAVEQYGILNGAPLRRFALQPPASLTRSLNARVGEATDTLCSLCVGQRTIQRPSSNEVNEIHRGAQQNRSIGGRRSTKHASTVFLCSVYNNTGPQSGLASVHHVQKDQDDHWGANSESINLSLETSATGIPSLHPNSKKGKKKKRKGKVKQQSPRSPKKTTSSTVESGDSKHPKPYRQLVFTETPIASIATVDALGLIVVGGDGRLHTTRMSELTSRALPCLTLEEFPNTSRESSHHPHDGRDLRGGLEKLSSVEGRPSPTLSSQFSRVRRNSTTPPLYLMAIFHGRLIPRPLPLQSKATTNTAAVEMSFPTHTPTAQLLSCLLPIVVKARRGAAGVHLVVSGRCDGLVQLWDVDHMVECFRFQATWGGEIGVTALDYQSSGPVETRNEEGNPLFVAPHSTPDDPVSASSNDNVDGFLAVGDQAGCVLLIGISTSSLLASRRSSEATTLESPKGMLAFSLPEQHSFRLTPKPANSDALPSIYNVSRNMRSASEVSVLRRISIWSNPERAFSVLGRWNAHEHGSGGVRNVCFAGLLNYFEGNSSNMGVEGENSQEVVSQIALRSTLSFHSYEKSGTMRGPTTATEHLIKHTAIFIASAGADSYAYVWRWEQGIGVQCVGCFGGDDVAVWPRSSVIASGLVPPFNFPPHPSWCQAYEDARCQYVLNRLIKDACFFVVSKSELAALISPVMQQSTSHSSTTDTKSDFTNVQTERKFLTEVAKALLFMSKEVRALVAADPVWKHSVNLLEKDINKGHNDCIKVLEKGALERFRVMSISSCQTESCRNKSITTMFGKHGHDYNSLDDRYSSPSFIPSSQYASYVLAFMHGTYTYTSIQECLDHTVRVVLATQEGLAAVQSASNKLHVWYLSNENEETPGMLSKTSVRRRSIPCVTVGENSSEPRSRRISSETGSVGSTLPELSRRHGSTKRMGSLRRVGSQIKRASTQAYDFDSISSVGSSISNQDHSKSTLVSSRTNSMCSAAEQQLAATGESPLGGISQMHTGVTPPELHLETTPHPESTRRSSRLRLRSSYLKVPLGVAVARLSRVSERESPGGSRRASSASTAEGSLPARAGTGMGSSRHSHPDVPAGGTRRRRSPFPEETLLKPDFAHTLWEAALSKNASNRDTRDTAAVTGLQGFTAYAEFAAAAARAKGPGGGEPHPGGKKPLFEDFSTRGRSRIAGRAFIREILARHVGAAPAVVAQTSAQSVEQDEDEDWYEKRERQRLRQRREEAIWNTPRVMQNLMTWSSREPSEAARHPGNSSMYSSSASTHPTELTKTMEWESSEDGKFQPISISSFGISQDGTPFSVPERPDIPSFIPLYLNPNRLPQLQVIEKAQKAHSPERKINGSKPASSGAQSNATGPSFMLPRGKAFLQAQAEKEIAAMQFHRTVASEVEAMRQHIRDAVHEREELECE